MSGRLWATLGFSAATAFLVWVFIGDLALDDVIDDNPPPVVVEMDHVTLRRGMSGDLWIFDVTSVKRVMGIGDLEGIVGRRTAPDGSLWTLSAPSGEYVEKGDRLSLSDGTGTFHEGNENFVWKAPVILWGGPSSDVWSFPDGLRVSGDRYSLCGRSGEADPSGRVFLEEGVMEWWSED